jgi:adenylate cyclase
VGVAHPYAGLLGTIRERGQIFQYKRRKHFQKSPYIFARTRSLTAPPDLLYDRMLLCSGRVSSRTESTATDVREMMIQIRAEKLNHQCDHERGCDRMLLANSACGVFQQNRSIGGISAPRRRVIARFVKPFYHLGWGGYEIPLAREQRRLAAILAADVVGYSRLMGRDESGTVAHLREHRQQRLEPTLARHGGRLVKLMGDGVLAEFPSAVDALGAAIEFQQALADANQDQRDDTRIVFRIGLHLGDLIVDGDDLYGDGVNVAARLEAEAPAGGILISGNVHDAVAGRLKASFDDRGSLALKNIERPVQAFGVKWEPADWKISATAMLPTAATPRSAGVPPALPDKPSIAVLPFANMSGDVEQEYFSDGITEDIITDLSKVSGLLVIARNSSFTYKGRAMKIPDVCRELGVAHVLEGSVRKAGNRVRVTAQLIEGATGGHVWAERYDRDLADVFAVQDELTGEIVGALKVRLTEHDRDRLRSRASIGSDAYDLFLRGRELVWLHTRVEGQTGQALLRQAIALAPDFAKAHGLLAFARCHEFVNGWGDDPAGSLRLARELAEKAVSLAPDDGECHWALAVVLLWQREHDRSLAEGATCIALEPNSTLGHAQHGHALLYAGRPAEALKVFAQLRRLDPYFPDLYLHFMAQAHFNLEQYAEAETILRQRNARNPNSESSRVLLASTLGHLGRTQEARAEWREALRINPSYSLEQRRKSSPFKNAEDFERMATGLRKASLPD